MLEQDRIFMGKALKLAKKAAKRGEVPIGALVVTAYGQIIGQGYNCVEKYKCQNQHAEARAIVQAAKHKADWRLDQCTLYVTLEPCMMCMGLLALSRIERVVYGAQSPLFGFHLDKEGLSTLYTRQIKNITEGVLAAESSELLKEFFTQKREKKNA